MEIERTQEVGDSAQRVVVDANNPEKVVPDTKKPQVPQEVEKKSKDLGLGDQVHNVLFTAYNVLRQHHNQTAGNLITKLSQTDYKVSFRGREYTKGRDAIHQVVFETAQEQGVPFAHYTQSSPQNWYGIAGPLLNFLSGFGMRRKELRLGHHQMPLVKRGNQERVVNVTQYGIYGCHHILCEGISFPPEKRASMPQSLGPLTIPLCYLRSERQYSAK
ncbi:hypothetical protein ANTRET_LOCUS9910 [Anthophora retusa]